MRPATVRSAERRTSANSAATPKPTAPTPTSVRAIVSAGFTATTCSQDDPFRERQERTERQQRTEGSPRRRTHEQCCDRECRQQRQSSGLGQDPAIAPLATGGSRRDRREAREDREDDTEPDGRRDRPGDEGDRREHQHVGAPVAELVVELPPGWVRFVRRASAPSSRLRSRRTTTAAGTMSSASGTFGETRIAAPPSAPIGIAASVSASGLTAVRSSPPSNGSNPRRTAGLTRYRSMAVPSDATRRWNPAGSPGRCQWTSSRRRRYAPSASR